MLSLRDFITNQIDNESTSGEEICEILSSSLDDGDLGEIAEEKAMSLIDALVGWCAPECKLGTGNYGHVSHA